MKEYEFVCYKTKDKDLRRVTWSILDNPIDENGMEFITQCYDSIYFFRHALLSWDHVYQNHNELLKLFSDNNGITCPMRHELYNFEMSELSSLVIMKMCNLLNSSTVFLTLMGRCIENAEKKSKWHTYRKDLHKSHVEYRLCYELRNQLQHASWPLSSIALATSPEHMSMNLFMKLEPAVLPDNNKLLKILDGRNSVELNHCLDTYVIIISKLANYFLELHLDDHQKQFSFIQDVRRQLGPDGAVAVVPKNTPDSHVVERSEFLEFESFDWICQKIEEIQTVANSNITNG